MEDSADTESYSAGEAVEDLRELPTASRLVWYTLKENDLTLEELVDETLLPERTATYSLNRLEEIDAVEERPYVEDPRKTVYSLQEPYIRVNP